MELGLFTEPQVGGSYEQLRKLAVWAERTGLDVFARSDHYLNMEQSAPSTDALTSLGGLARDTESIELAVLVTPLTFRHPAVIAKTAATLDEMSRGRFALGVGTGWMEPEHAAFGLDLPPLRERFSKLYETLAYLRAAFDEGAVEFEGRHYRLAKIEVHPGRTGRLPIIVGGGGMNKTPTMAGRFADEYNMFVTDPETLAARLDVMRDAADEAGRDPADIKLSVAGPNLVFETEAEYRAAISERAAKRDMDPEDYEDMLATRNVPRGTPRQAAEAVAALAGLGVQRYYVQEYKALGEIDTDHLEMVFSALRT